MNHEGPVRGIVLIGPRRLRTAFVELQAFDHWSTLIKPGPLLLPLSLGDSILLSLDGYGSPEYDSGPLPFPCHAVQGEGPGLEQHMDSVRGSQELHSWETVLPHRWPSYSDAQLTRSTHTKQLHTNQRTWSGGELMDLEGF